LGFLSALPGGAAFDGEFLKKKNALRLKAISPISNIAIVCYPFTRVVRNCSDALLIKKTQSLQTRKFLCELRGKEYFEERFCYPSHIIYQFFLIKLFDVVRKRRWCPV
jgi:hypothetical protein